MILEQMSWDSSKGWIRSQTSNGVKDPQLVLVFASTAQFKSAEQINALKEIFPGAGFMGCSTSGEIAGTKVRDESVVATAVQFEKGALSFVSVPVHSSENSFESGQDLIDKLPKDGLRHVFVLSDGLNVNGSELVRGLRLNLPKEVAVTGGLAGDGADFKETYILDKSGTPSSHMVTAIGFYGDDLQFGYGSFGGWDTFGIDRQVTKSKNNVLFEIDGQPALSLYKSFLGESANSLPASGLLFPLSLRSRADELPVVRTILSVNEADQSITFAGDLPEGSFVRMMKANTERIIQGAVKAAETTMLSAETTAPDLAILISCVGRKLVLKQMVEEEVEGAAEVLGAKQITGFYSYGEISPFSENAACELHNQTMTITTISER
jgi:hypothetical protein